MKRFALLLTLTILAVPSNAVEFGQDATGDPNAVDVQGSSGFLYSDRIVFTAAHVIVGVEVTNAEDIARAVANWERESYIYRPGIGNRFGEKKYRVKKVLIEPTYRSRVGRDQTRVSDFAILILQESIPTTNQVVVASNEDIQNFIKEKAPVMMIGYGLQSPSQRTPPQFGTLSPRKMTSYLVSNEELREYYRINSERIAPGQTILDYGIPNSEKFGSVCDGDSGAGFFVEKGNTRYYLGAVGGSQAGIPNCRSESWATFGIGGGMSGISTTNKYMNLIREAEAFVALEKNKEEEVRLALERKIKADEDAKAAVAKAKLEEEAKAKAEAELKAKLEMEARADADTALKAQQQARVKAELLGKKTTISCARGKVLKKITAVSPKCPSGFKLK